MKKKFVVMLSLVLCLLLSISLSACKGNTPDNPEGTSGTTEQTDAADKHEAKSEWKSNETKHWHECATEGHTDKLDEADHSWNDGVVTTQPTETADGVKTYTCTVCGATKTAPVHAFDTAWEKDATHHWHKATCGHTDEKDGYEEHSFGEWTEKTPADYGVNKVVERSCTVCGEHQEQTVEESAVPAKTNNVSVGTIDFIYSGNAQSINDLITADNKDGMVIKYEGTGETNYEESTTAPKNAGTYKYTITIPSTVEWKGCEKTGEFEIKKYQVRCPRIFVTQLAKGQSTTKILCEIDVTEDENIILDEITLIYSGTNFPDGVGAGRMNVGKNSIKVDPRLEANVEVVGLPAGSSGYVEWIVKDSDEFSFKRTGDIDASANCYQGTILHGSVQVGDKLIVVGTTSTGNLVKVNVTVTKIEYKQQYTTNYIETNVATKGEVIKITFTKDDNVVISSFDYIVAVQDMGTINQYQKAQATTELSFDSNEYRIFKVKIDTTQTIRITVTNEYAFLKVFDAKTGAEITLTGNKFQLVESTEILIVVKQTTTKGTHQITVETVEYSFGT